MSMKEKLAVTVLVTTLALFGLVVVLYRMIKDKNEDYTQIVLNQHSSYDSRTIPYAAAISWTGTEHIWLPVRRSTT